MIKKVFIKILVLPLVWLTCIPTHAEISFGNFKGNIVLIEYFSYNCPVCRSYMPVISYLTRENPGLEVIQRVVPPINPSAQIVARMILASYLQNKFPQFQNAILKAQIQGAISPQTALMLAKNVGLNTRQLAEDINRPIITNQLKENYKNFLKTHIKRIPVLVFYNRNNPSKKILMVGSQPLGKLQYAISLLSKRVIKPKRGEYYHAKK